MGSIQVEVSEAPLTSDTGLVPIHVRADRGFGVPVMYEVFEELGLTYTFGLGRNSVLQRRSKPLLAHAVQQSEQEYAERGESENRHKELKRGLPSDRLSDHRFLANFFRLSLPAAALNLLVRLRRVVAQPATPRQPGVTTDLPAPALESRQRKQFFNRRRDRDPLGEGHACTWRTRLIKVAAEVLTGTRRILLRLSGSWPHRDHSTAVTRTVFQFTSLPAPDTG